MIAARSSTMPGGDKKSIRERTLAEMIGSPRALPLARNVPRSAHACRRGLPNEACPLRRPFAQSIERESASAGSKVQRIFVAARVPDDDVVAVGKAAPAGLAAICFLSSVVKKTSNRAARSASFLISRDRRAILPRLRESACRAPRPWHHAFATAAWKPRPPRTERRVPILASPTTPANISARTDLFSITDLPNSNSRCDLITSRGGSGRKAVSARLR